MNQEQYERACAVVNADATTTGRYFTSDGQSCAVGGLFISLHPDWSYQELLDAMVDTEVEAAFGLTHNNLAQIIQANDRYQTDIDKRRASVVRLLGTLVAPAPSASAAGNPEE